MPIKDDYASYLKRQKQFQEKPIAKYWTEQEARYVEPFQIFGNLYYVGDSWVCVHLVDTGDGLLLFDAGNCGAKAMLIHSIWEMGFRPQDVKWIILSHGHVDHFGAAPFFRKMFGTKIYLGQPDAEMFRTAPEQSMIQESSSCMDMLFEADHEIEEGEILTFGNTSIQFYLVPGHTRGCISCFFNVTDGISVKRAGYYGGFGFNTLQKDFLLEIGDIKLEARKVYLNSIDKVISQKVDIFMGNHASNVDLLKKRQYMLEHPGKNPFLDSESWRNYLEQKKQELLDLEKSDSL